MPLHCQLGRGDPARLHEKQLKFCADRLPFAVMKCLIQLKDDSAVQRIA